jgi:hypothetical protein
MFIGGSLTLCSGAPSSALIVAVKTAWRLLRFEVPELAVSAGYGPDGKAYMQYQEPETEEEVNHWVERTTSFGCGTQGLGFQELLDGIRIKKRVLCSEQMFLMLHPVVEDVGDLVNRIDFMLNADHQLTDGIGIRILLHRFLHLLAQSLSGTPACEEGLNWRESASNLTPSWIGLMNEDQLLCGPEYERVAENNEDFLFQKMVLVHFIPQLIFIRPK